MRRTVAKSLLSLIAAAFLSVRPAHASWATLKNIALQEGPIQPGPDKPNHLKEFLATVESGKFDGQTVYMGASGTLAKELLNLHLDYWKFLLKKS